MPSGTGSGRSFSRVTASASASAARSASLKYGVSRHADTVTDHNPSFVSHHSRVARHTLDEAERGNVTDGRRWGAGAWLRLSRRDGRCVGVAAVLVYSWSCL